jgi:hypothetical protein
MLNAIQSKSQVTTITGKLGAPQIRLVTALLRHAWSELIAFQTHQIHFAKLADEIDLDREDVEGVKAAIRSVLSVTIKTKLLGGGCQFNKLLSEAEIRNGIVYYSFPPLVRMQVRSGLADA